MTKKMPVLPLGSTVLWYPHGDISQEPHAAIVTEIMEKHVYVLYRFPKGGGMPRRETNVHHITDQELVDNQNVAVRYGAWDTIENGENRRVSAAKAAAAVHERRAEEEAEREASEKKMNPKERILILSERGYAPDQIADTIKGGYTEETVAAIIRDSSMQKA
ncbi:MAG: hypothetical protein Unbinned1606contig1000_39 [Prokaryotic dsDNA virus sp.]|nr:MAG: hypothetical protein Unbinned1606contig1000_39 [Prokaryotic dsDNA virus sp.]|tara:strand:- start:27 stop:512 length:486 start_codon:yes stop_codon:yes gene_type:complete